MGLSVKSGFSPREIYASSYQFMSNKKHHTFESLEQLHAWLQVNHASETELWVRIYKKATGQLAALQQDPAAHAFYATLKRQHLFAIYYRLHSAKRPETRQKRMAELLAKLGRGESP
jgi:uncharacterized protein YdeI (YjbR/CyaY-like superfamily)